MCALTNVQHDRAVSVHMPKCLSVGETIRKSHCIQWFLFLICNISLDWICCLLPIQIQCLTFFIFILSIYNFWFIIFIHASAFVWAQCTIPIVYTAFNVLVLLWLYYVCITFAFRCMCALCSILSFAMLYSHFSPFGTFAQSCFFFKC